MGQKTDIARPSKNISNPRTSEQSNKKGPDEIRADIERTRAEMSETINSIKEKLSPEHFKEQIREKVKESTLWRAKKVMNITGEKAREVGSTILETVKQNPVPVGLMGFGLIWLIMKGTKVSPVRTLESKAKEKIQKITDVPQKEVQYQARRAKGKLQEMVHDNPLALGAAVLALGAVVGLIIPEAQSEQEFIGGTRDTLLTKAKKAAQASVE